MSGSERPELPKDTLALLQQQFGDSFQLNNLAEETDTDSSCESSQDGIQEATGSFDYLSYYKERFPERYGDIAAQNTTEGSTTERALENPVALITYEDEYVRKLLVQAFQEPQRKALGWTVQTTKDPTTTYHYHFADYEQIDWFSEAFERQVFSCSCYYNRKGLIRKANIAAILNKWQKKHPSRPHISPKSHPLVFVNTDPEQLTSENILNRLQSSELELEDENAKFIVKPSMTNQAEGISLAQGKDKLVEKILQCDELSLTGGLVVQEYIEPFLLKGLKFHLRVFVLLVGDLTVYVSQDFLSIFSLQPYEANKENLANTRAHLTNISHQFINSKEDEYNCMRLFDETMSDFISSNHAANEEEAMSLISAFKQRVNEIAAEVVEAASHELTLMLRKNCFELFGFDFLINKQREVYFLEANAEPDLSKAGDRLQHVIDSILRDTVTITTDCNPNFPTPSDPAARQHRLKLVYERKRQY